MALHHLRLDVQLRRYPRWHLLRYFGVLASHSSARVEVMPYPPEDDANEPPPAEGDQSELPYGAGDAPAGEPERAE